MCSSRLEVAIHVMIEMENVTALTPIRVTIDSHKLAMMP